MKRPKVEQWSVCTLADESYLPGLSGLINSLRAHGFDGRIIVGVPARTRVLDRIEGVETVVLDDSSWMGLQKPALLLRQATERFVFLDADIVIGDAPFLELLNDLTEHAPALALEGIVGPGDYRRLRWAARLSQPVMPHAWGYYNTGFVAGRLSRDRSLLEAWAASNADLLPHIQGLFQDDDFPLADQDVLNGLLQASPSQVSSLQFPDWWSAAAQTNPFLTVGALAKPAFYHSTGPKPWNLASVPPRKPTPYESLWFHHTVIDPSPMALPCRLPRAVQSWLAQSMSSRVIGRTKRVARRLVGGQ